MPQRRPIFLLLMLSIFSAWAAPCQAAEQVIRFWNALAWGEPKTAMTELVRDFNERHKGQWRVEMLLAPNVEQKILTAVAGRVAPDVVMFDRVRIAAFAERGAFRDVSELMDDPAFARAQYFGWAYDESMYQGKLYGLPFNADNRLLFYNRQHFREAGLDPDRPPRTWAELEDYARKLTVRDARGRITRLGFAPIYGNSTLFMYGFLNGGRFMDPAGQRVTMTDPRVVGALAWMKRFCDAYGIEELDRFSSGFGSDAFYPFVAGKFSMDCQEGFLTSLLRKYNPTLDYMVAPMPLPEGGERASWGGGFGLVFPVESRNHAGALALARDFLSRTVQVNYGKIADQIPALTAAAYDEHFMRDPRRRVFINEMPYTHNRPVSPITSQMYDEQFRAIDFAVHGRQTPQAALERANQVLQESLDRQAEKHALPPIHLPRIVALLVLAGVALCGLRAWQAWRHIRRSRLHGPQMLKGYLFALPAILGLMIFVFIPVLVSLVFSFTHYEILTPARWLGLENYRRLFTADPLFSKSLWNTVVFTVLSVPFGIVVAIVLALLLNREFRGRSLFRTLFFIPSIVPLVATSILWMWLYNGEYGIINQILGWVGLPPIRWLSDETLAKPALVLMGVWGVGGGMIIALAGLQGIPRALYEAADIDGANLLQRLWHITLPMLSPTLFFMLIMGIIGSFQVFTQAYVMTAGGPRDATLFYVLYMFNQGFNYFNMGYASAMAWVLLVIIAALSFVQFRLASRWVQYER